MSSDSDNDRPQSSEDSSEDTTTLLGENERLKKELSEKEELIRTQTAKVSELEKELQELRLQAVSPTSSPSNQGSEKTPAKSPPSSIQSQGSLTAKELFPDSAKGEDGNTGEGHKSMTVPQKLELMVGKVENITKEVTKLKKVNEQLKKRVELA
jgi:hypothetical protein